MIQPFLASRKIMWCPTGLDRPGGNRDWDAFGSFMNIGINWEISHDNFTGLIASYGTQPNTYREQTIVRPTSTVYTTDLGNVAVPGVNPTATVQTPYGSPSVISSKASAWLLIYPTETAPTHPYSQLVLSAGDADYAGPIYRHNKRVNVSFVDGHVDMMGETWYYDGSPWLNGLVGGP